MVVACGGRFCWIKREKGNSFWLRCSVPRSRRWIADISIRGMNNFYEDEEMWRWSWRFWRIPCFTRTDMWLFVISPIVEPPHKHHDFGGRSLCWVCPNASATIRREIRFFQIGSKLWWLAGKEGVKNRPNFSYQREGNSSRRDGNSWIVACTHLCVLSAADNTSRARAIAAASSFGRRCISFHSLSLFSFSPVDSTREWLRMVVGWVSL